MMIANNQQWHDAHDEARELFARRKLLDQSLKELSPEQITRRNDILSALDSIEARLETLAAAVEEYDRLLKWERDQDDNLPAYMFKPRPRPWWKGLGDE